MTGGSAAAMPGWSSRSLIFSLPLALGLASITCVVDPLTLPPSPPEDDGAPSTGPGGVASAWYRGAGGRGGQDDLVALLQAGDHLGVLVIGQADLDRARLDAGRRQHAHLRRAAGALRSAALA